MRIEDDFYFGKYEGLTIKQVYQGTKDINKDLLKSYLHYKISFKNPLSQDTILTELMNFEISDTLIRVTPKEHMELIGNWGNMLESLLKNGNSWLDREFGIKSIDEFNIKDYSVDKNESFITGGNPEYIEWCIKNVDYFYLDPEELIELQTYDVFRFLGIDVIHKIEDMHEYKPKFKIEKFIFSEDALKLNQTKFDSINFMEEDENNENHDDYYESRTFENYNGSYAQDVEGYSDQDIDDVFEGDPDAYWNID